MKSTVVVHFPFEKVPKKAFEVKESDTFEDLKNQITKTLKREISNWLFVEVLRGYERRINKQEKIINEGKFLGRLMMRESKEESENDMSSSLKSCQYSHIWTPIHVPKIIISRTLKLLTKLQRGLSISEKERSACLKLYFSGDPLFEVYLKNQGFFTKKKGVYGENFINVKGISGHTISFNQDYPLIMNKEYSKLLTIASDYSSKLKLEVYPYSSQGDFLGTKVSRRTLVDQYEESRISLILCPLSPLYSLGLVIIECEIEDIQKKQYLILNYNKVVNTDIASPYWQINLSELVENKTKILGTGATSFVYESTLYGNVVACKTLLQQNNMSDVSLFRREIDNLKNIHLRHPNIITFIGASDKRPFRIITELLKYSLQTMIETESGQDFSYFKRYRIALDIVYALHHLHKAGYLHKDLKSANIMITHGYRAKLGDLGFSEYIGVHGRCKGVVGTPPWMAPEVCSGDYGFEADIFSFGVTLFELFTFKTIFDHWADDENLSIIHRIMRWRQSLHVEEEGLFMVGKLIKSCCHPIPSKRPKLDKIITILKLGLKKSRNENEI